jgi:hypothetical protein
MTDEDRYVQQMRCLAYRSAVVISFCTGLGLGMILHGLGVPLLWALGPAAAIGTLWMTRAMPPNQKDR